MKRFVAGSLILLGLAPVARPQVYSPTVLKAGQPDSTDLKRFAEAIYAQAGATTPREKAEAIWRFFLTDGRFVTPGFWYHIAGWAYEEPTGEVLDPIKLLNSYGFGLCYHIAPLLSAVWKAGGFEDARVWFLTGHTVAEVFYDGAYHYFDSDMMGYNPIGSGPLKQRPVASVHQIEQDGNIILSKLVGKREVANVDQPWYPADVRADAIPGLAELFTTTKDNWLYPSKRYPEGHQMDFVLRPGEKMIRYFHPEPDGLYYLPYKFDGTKWVEFPQEIAQYKIRTADGPQSQKDARRWATGVIEYRPPASSAPSMEIAMPCPYVIIDANFKMDLALKAGESLAFETSSDDGRTWVQAGSVNGPFQGAWSAEPATVVRSAHGRLTAVSGTYGYLVRASRPSAIRNLVLTTRFQLNPRTLPELAPGRNELTYSHSQATRQELPVRVERIQEFAAKVKNAEVVGSKGQSYLVNQDLRSPAEIIFKLDGKALSGFDAGARFLDLRDGLAPDKLTAETRKVKPWPDSATKVGSIEWASSLEGPYQTIWSYDAKPTWKDGEAIDRTLRWPEADRQVRGLPSGTQHVYVRYRAQGMAIDDIRLATVQPAGRAESPVKITHIWKQNGSEQSHRETLNRNGSYVIDIPRNASVVNEALVLECPAEAKP